MPPFDGSYLALEKNIVIFFLGKFKHEVDTADKVNVHKNVRSEIFRKRCIEQLATLTFC